MKESLDSLSPPSPFTRGLVEVFTGDGKGKTSAALGIVLRAAGHGLKVFIVYFMKGDRRYGEEKALAYLPGVTFVRFGQHHFVRADRVTQEEREEARRALETARETMLSGEYQIVVLDEVNVAVSYNLISVEDVVSLMQVRPPGVELVLTGRGAHPRIVELADLVTEMVEIKHPYAKGIPARQGVDY